MPSALPYYRHFTGDCARETRHLSTLEYGAYRLLMDAYWDNGGPLPLDPVRLRRITRTTKASWAKIEAIVLELFDLQNGAIIHRALDQELSRASGRVKSARASGQASGASRRGEAQGTNAERTLNERSTERERASNSSSSDSSSSLRSEEERDSSVPSESRLTVAPLVSKAQRNAAELEAAFDEFWKIYPRKTGPTVARRVWRREIKLAFVPDVIQAALRYADLREGEPEQFTKLASTWLNKGVWRDSLTDEAPKPGVKGNGFETRSERNVRNLKAIQEQFGLGQVFDFRGDSDEGGHLLGPGDSDAGRSLGDRPGVDGSHRREDNPDEPTQ